MKLPLNCEVEYFHDFLNTQTADALFAELRSIMEASTYCPRTLDGQSFEVNFKKMMFLDQHLLDENTFPEAYWGPNCTWTESMQALKNQVELLTNETFPVCVLIYYPDGNSGVDFHSDYTAFGDTSIIPSISLGEERVFILREKYSGAQHSETLAHGSMIIMGEGCQEKYEHSLPLNPSYKNPRINLTFRKFGF